MREWFENVAGPQYASALMWTVAALIVLVILLVLIRIIGNLTSGTFVAGGRNRKARLAIMDAAAVDSQRRLVLVRRDDVEHLILIGGSTDVVVEQNITFAGAVPRSAPNTEEIDNAAPRLQAPPSRPHSGPAYPERPRPVPAAGAPARPQQSEPIVRAPRDVRPPERTQPAVPPAGVTEPRPVTPSPRPVAAPPPRPVTAPPVTAAQPSSPQPPAPAVQPLGGPPPPVSGAPRAPDTARPPAEPIPPLPPVTPKPAAGNDIDAALARELEASLDISPAAQRPAAENSLEDEMTRLLGELSRERRK